MTPDRAEQPLDRSQIDLRDGQPLSHPYTGFPGDFHEAASVDLTIDELAELTKMTARNVRAYQQRRLLPPARRRGRRLVYGWEHVARLRLIRTLHARGLSLRMIEDLVARGAEEEELARIGVEATPSTERVRVPIGELSVSLLSAGDPQAIKELVEAGVVHLENGELVAGSASLGVAGALLSHGVDIGTICQVVVLASRAAQSVAEHLQKEVTEIEGLDGETVSLAIRLASVTFNDSLLDRIDELMQEAGEVGDLATRNLPGIVHDLSDRKPATHDLSTLGTTPVAVPRQGG